MGLRSAQRLRSPRWKHAGVGSRESDEGLKGAFGAGWRPHPIRRRSRRTWTRGVGARDGPVIDRACSVEAPGGASDRLCGSVVTGASRDAPASLCALDSPTISGSRASVLFTCRWLVHPSSRRGGSRGTEGPPALAATERLRRIGPRSWFICHISPQTSFATTIPPGRLGSSSSARGRRACSGLVCKACTLRALRVCNACTPMGRKMSLQASDQVQRGSSVRRSSRSARSAPIDVDEWPPEHWIRGLREKRAAIANLEAWCRSAELSIVRQARAQGRSAGELAAALGVSRRTVYNRFGSRGQGS